MGWEKLHLGLQLEKAAGKGCPEARDPTAPPPWGTGHKGHELSPFLGMLFPTDLWDLCCPSAPPPVLAALVFGHGTKSNKNQPHFQAFSGISRHFQSFPGISSGFGEREGELLLFQAVPCQPRPHPTVRCQEWGDTMRCPPQHPQWTQIQGNLWIHPCGLGPRRLWREWMGPSPHSGENAAR